MVGRRETGETLRRAGVGRRQQLDDNDVAHPQSLLHLPQHWLRPGRRKTQRRDGSDDDDEDYHDNDGGGRKVDDQRSSEASDSEDDDNAGRTALHGREQALKTNKVPPVSATASIILNPAAKQNLSSGAKKKERQQQSQQPAPRHHTAGVPVATSDATVSHGEGGPSLSLLEGITQARDDDNQNDDDHSSSSNPNPPRQKRKRPKKRSRQKNVVKDHRPLSERPQFGQRPLTSATMAKLGETLRGVDDDGSGTTAVIAHPPALLPAAVETKVHPIVESTFSRVTEPAVDAEPTTNIRRKKKKQKYKNLT